MWELELTLGWRIVNNVDADHLANMRNANEDVISLKWKIATLIDQFDELRNTTDSQDVKRLSSITISKLEEACMFWVKSLTYNS